MSNTTLNQKIDMYKACMPYEIAPLHSYLRGLVDGFAELNAISKEEKEAYLNEIDFIYCSLLD